MIGIGGAHASETLRIGTDPDYPPFSQVTPDGRYIGFEVEIGNLLCSRMRIRCEWVGLNFADLIPALLDRRIDAIMGSLAITPARRRIVSFTSKYYSTPIRMVGPRGIDETVLDREIPGTGRQPRIGVVAGTTHADYIDNHLEGRALAVPFPAQKQAEDALTSGEIDLLLADALVLWTFLKDGAGKEFDWVGPPIHGDEGIGIALRPEDRDLRQRFEDALVEILRDGSYARINARHFPFNVY
ncbi:MAG TPA: transporter substrate-binding domain-containing protein [Arenibaculum sp.]|nr:transporter substrate-binding domain-containing protein [Arenibaculum sp.]